MSQLFRTATRFAPDGSGAGVGIDGTRLPYAVTLHRPLLDLGPLEHGPLFVHFVDCAYENVVAPTGSPLFVQWRTSTAVRRQIIDESGLHHYDVERPHDLAPPLRSERWQRVVDLVGDFDRLALGDRINLVILLEALGLYASIAELTPPSEDPRSPLARLRRKAMAQRDGTPDACTTDIRGLEQLASLPDIDDRERLSVAMTLVVSYARGRNRDRAQVSRWRRVAEGLYPLLRPERAWRDTLLASTYWRAVSYEPFLGGDRERVALELDRAEQLARAALRCETRAERITAALNLHPLLETRTKEAMWLGDKDLALARARALVATDPFDAKAAVQLGDVHLDRGEIGCALELYRAAARLGAPYTAFARFMIGVCLEGLGDLAGACDAFALAIEADRSAVTPAERLAKAARRRGDLALQRWAEEVLEIRLGHLRAASRIAHPGTSSTSN